MSSKDERTLDQKLGDMASRGTPNEREIAKRKIAERKAKARGDGPDTRNMPHKEFMAWMRAEQERKGMHPLFYRPGRQTHESVIDAFVSGQGAKSRKTDVPGGRRLQVKPSMEPDATDLYSYNTIIARRHGDESISITPRRYSVTTSKQMSHLVRRMGNDYAPSGETREVVAQVPGRWGGWGPAWHETGEERLPFIHFRKQRRIT